MQEAPGQRGRGFIMYKLVRATALSLAASVFALSFSSSISSAEEPIKIAHVYGKTGPFEAYAKQSHVADDGAGIRHRRYHGD